MLGCFAKSTIKGLLELIADDQNGGDRTHQPYHRESRPQGEDYAAGYAGRSPHEVTNL